MWKKISQNKLMASCLLAAALSFQSCSSTQTQDSAPELSSSEADLLGAEEVSVPNGDADVFADLQESNGIVTPGLATDPMTVDFEADDSRPFYNPVGGESLGRVAYMLYGSHPQKKNLLAENPALQGVKTLVAGQKVYFDFEKLSPNPTYLTKDLIDRYSVKLAGKLELKNDQQGLVKTTATVAHGDTLQALSQRLYGTTRYWTEIYLLNQSKVASYDKVMAGTTLVVYQRNTLAAVGATSNGPSDSGTVDPLSAESQMAASETTNAPSHVDAESNSAGAQAEALSASEPVPPVLNTPSSGAMDTQMNQQQNLAPIPDPIPETPMASDSRNEQQQAPAVSAMDPSSWTASIGANTRRVIYVALILLVVGAAFYMTRPSKKNKFDMLEATAQETAASRAKLGGGKDTHNKVVG